MTGACAALPAFLMLGLRRALPAPDRLSRHPDWGRYKTGSDYNEDNAEWSLKMRTESYLERLKRLANNLRLQATIGIIASLSLFATDGGPIPVLGIGLESIALYITLPLAISFLWLQFGHQLAALIGIRLHLWHVLSEIEEHREIPADSMYSRRSFLDLGMLMESWFALFIPKAYQEPLESLSLFHIVSLVPYGLLLGAIHGLAYAMLGSLGLQLISDSLSASSALAVTLVIQLFAAAFFSGTHYLFYFVVQNRNWFSFLVVGWTPIAAIIFAALAFELPSEMVSPAQADILGAPDSGIFAFTDQYCERTGPGIWEEPVNTVSNVAFFFAALLTFPRAIKHDGDGRYALIASALLIAILGLGSTLFHLFANRVTEWLDILPIVSFQLLFLWVYLRRAHIVTRTRSAICMLAFVAASAAALLSPPVLNGSIIYAPAVAALLILAFMPTARRLKTRLLLYVIVGVFSISLIARTLDNALCHEHHVGSHFMWHLCNACVLYLSFEVLRRVARQ
mgnify:FL=1